MSFAKCILAALLTIGLFLLPVSPATASKISTAQKILEAINKTINKAAGETRKALLKMNKTNIKDTGTVKSPTTAQQNVTVHFSTISDDFIKNINDSRYMRNFVDDATVKAGIVNAEKAALFKAELHRELLKTFLKILNEVPVHNVNLTLPSLNRFALDLRKTLDKLSSLENAKRSPQYVFEISSGQLTFPKLGSISGLEIKGGSINIYKGLSIAGATAVCIIRKCNENNLKHVIKVIQNQILPDALSPPKSQ